MLSNILQQIVRIAEVIVFVILGFAAYKQKDIKINAVDKIINREIKEDQEETNE